MKKLCFVVLDQTAATTVLDAIRNLGISNEQIHAIANDSVELSALPDADIIEENDVIGGVARGAVTGAAVGMLAGLAVAVFPAAGIVAASSIIATSAVGGASFGVWMGAMVGSSVPNSQLEEWQHQIDQGNILIVVEVDEDKEPLVLEILNNSKYNIVEFSEKDASIPLI